MPSSGAFQRGLEQKSGYFFDMMYMILKFSYVFAKFDFENNLLKLANRPSLPLYSSSVTDLCLPILHHRILFIDLVPDESTSEDT